MPQFDTPINTNDQGLERVLANPLPVILILNGISTDPDLQSILAEVARHEVGKLLIAKLDIAENPVAAKRFDAHGGVTLVTSKEGAEAVRLENPTPEQVRQSADYLLGRGSRPEPTVAAESANAAHEAVHPFTVNEANFEQQVLNSDQPVLVDFWAPWCGPCHMIAPTLEKFAGEYAGRLTIAKLNVDENQRLARKYGAHSIPLLVLFKNGKPVQQVIGAHPEPSLRKFVEQALR